VLALGGAVRCIVVADCWANRLLLVTREGLEITAIGVGAEGHADVHPRPPPLARVRRVRLVRGEGRSVSD